MFGKEGINQEFSDAGISASTNAEYCDAVVAGMHTSFTYDDIAKSYEVLLKGHPIILANDDLYDRLCDGI